MRPNKRTADLVIETTGDETLIYDLNTDHAHCLDAAAAAVWDACDGKTGPARIARETGLGEHEVVATLARLEGLELIESGGSTRRQGFQLAALAGAGVAAMAVPGIRSLVAPTVAQAASFGGPSAPCSTGAECNSGVCASGVCA